MNDVHNYIKLIRSFDEILNQSILTSIKAYLEDLDLQFTNFIDRRRKHPIKDFCSRTILTIFGESTFNRHFFKSKLDGKSFCYIDRRLDLKKFEYFDPYIRSLVIEKTSQNSISKACRDINQLIGNRVSLNNKTAFLSRQSARNIILNSLLSTEEDTPFSTPKELYILADEKWISTQSFHNNNNHDNKIMAKSIIIFDGYTSKDKKRFLSHKKVFASFDSNIVDASLDYINKVYDVDKIERVFVMSDSAKWIKSLPSYYKFNKNTDTIFCFDKFHFKQALHHLAMSSSYEKKLRDYILKNNKDAFTQDKEKLHLNIFF